MIQLRMILSLFAHEFLHSYHWIEPSMGAGLPSWEQPLANLGDLAQLSSQARDAMKDLDFLDQAQILKQQLNTKGLNINEEIAKMTQSPYYALAHALLSSFQAAEAVTQNYDDMYEQAAHDTSADDVAIIPYQLASGSKRWYLKMHGDVHHPKDVVLTRDDYLEYGSSREALSGIVQTLLMTRHMLILGFSLTDEHVIELACTLRKAVGDMKRDGPLGSVITLKPDKLRSQLWQSEVNFYSAADDETISTGEAARQLEILLDYIGTWGHRSWGFLFDDVVEPLLSPETIALRDGLRSLVKTVGEDNPITKDFAAMLRSRYGFQMDQEDL